MGVRCAATGVELVAGEPYIGALCETEEEPGMIRLDYAVSAWEGAPRPARLIAWWRGVVQRDDSKKKPRVDAEGLMGLFEQLGESREARHVAFRYVVALLLVRQRVLTMTGVRESDGGSVLLVKPRGATPEEPATEVEDPRIDEVMLADITEQMRAALGIEA